MKTCHWYLQPQEVMNLKWNLKLSPDKQQVCIFTYIHVNLKCVKLSDKNFLALKVLRIPILACTLKLADCWRPLLCWHPPTLLYSPAVCGHRVCQGSAGCSHIGIWILCIMTDCCHIAGCGRLLILTSHEEDLKQKWRSFHKLSSVLLELFLLNRNKETETET